MEISEDVYEGELLRYPGAWSFLLGKSHLILVSDAELEILAREPDREIDLSLTYQKETGSLRSVCEKAQAAGHRTLIVAFDHFFHQYRPGQFEPRALTPDSDGYIERIAAIGAFAARYGLGLELSLLSPLEIGPAYADATGESGVWMHYRKGLRDPETGAFSVSLLRQTRWANNKGVLALEDDGIRVFAFRERRVTGTPYRAVDPDEIVEITDTAQVEEVVGAGLPTGARQVRLFGRGRADIGPLDRVLAVQRYRTPEMDYFSENALPYLTGLIDRYADAGVPLNALYSDEMHIQQDWIYFSHHDHGQFALRYVSPGLERAFAAAHGPQYADFAKWLVYFCYGQEDFAHDLSASEGAMHALGDTPEAIQETALLRSRYYALLQNGVVDLFAAAKRHAETRMGKALESRAHATWAESPTIDCWRTGSEPLYRSAYEYTSDFVWSNTVHQAASACHDYFKWTDFLSASGNDHCECGYADRNYVGIALAASIGMVAQVPYAYAAHWGLPEALSRRRQALVDASGSAGSPRFGMVQEMTHRSADVLFLYPLDLVAVEERFGSWMTQYAYANTLPQATLLSRGTVEDGAVTVGGQRFTTVAALFEPFPQPGLLATLRRFVEGGGRLVWSGPPPLVGADGAPVRAEWETLFGVHAPATVHDGLQAPGKEVRFEGALARLAPQIILTDFLVDRIYPVTPAGGTQVVARVKGQAVGTRRAVGKGTATFLGFRPRDDQSRSLGYESRTWFEALRALGAHAGDDCPEALSRTTDYLCCRFPNGAVGIAPHFRETEEGWPGGFGRDAARDAEYLARFPPPSEAIALDNFLVAGHRVRYAGRHAVAFRADAGKRLIAFAGQGCRSIAVDGVETVFADREMEEVAWAPVPATCRVTGGAVLRFQARGAGTLSLPVAEPGPLRVAAEGARPGSRGETLPSRREGDRLVIAIPEACAGRWLYALSG